MKQNHSGDSVVLKISFLMVSDRRNFRHLHLDNVSFYFLWDQEGQNQREWKESQTIELQSSDKVKAVYVHIIFPRLHESLQFGYFSVLAKTDGLEKGHSLIHCQERVMKKPSITNVNHSSLHHTAIHLAHFCSTGSLCSAESQELNVVRLLPNTPNKTEVYYNVHSTGIMPVECLEAHATSSSTFKLIWNPKICFFFLLFYF